MSTTSLVNVPTPGMSPVVGSPLATSHASAAGSPYLLTTTPCASRSGIVGSPSPAT